MIAVEAWPMRARTLATVFDTLGAAVPVATDKPLTPVSLTDDRPVTCAFSSSNPRWWWRDLANGIRTTRAGKEDGPHHCVGARTYLIVLAAPSADAIT
jgi:hypothetical protein